MAVMSETRAIHFTLLNLLLCGVFHCKASHWTRGFDSFSFTAVLIVALVTRQIASLALVLMCNRLHSNTSFTGT